MIPITARHNVPADVDRASGKLLVPIFFSILALAAYVVVSFGKLSISTEMSLIMVLAGIVYLLTFIDLRIGLALMLIAIGSSFEFSMAGVDNLRLEDFIVPVLFLSWLTRVVDKKESFEATGLKMPILLSIFISAVSSLKAIAYEELTLKMAFFYFGKMVEYFIIFLIYLNNIKEEKEAKTFIFIAVMASLAVGIMGIFQYYSGGYVKIIGPAGETSNILGGYVVFHIAIILGLLLAGGASGRFKLFILAALAVNFFTLLFTLSRTSYIALFGGVIFLGLRKPKMFLYIFVIIIILPFLAPEGLVNRASSILDIFGPKPPSSFEARKVAILSYGQRIPYSPLIGKGVGAVNLTIDNEYIKRAVETGVLGLLVFLWFLLKMFLIGNTSYNNMKEKDKILAGFMLGYLAGLVCLMIHGIGATSFTTIRTMEPLMAITGIVGAIHNRFPMWEEEHKKAEQTETLYMPFKIDRRALFGKK